MQTMDKKDVAQVLEKMGELLEIKGANPFKVRAFYNGARIIESVTQDLTALVENGSLKKVKGIGPGLFDVISELIKTGHCTELEKWTKSLPSGLLDLLRIQGLGPKRVKVLYEKLGIENLGQLEYACRENRLINLDGFGEKSQSKILKGIQHHSKTKGHFLVSQGVSDSAPLVRYLKKKKQVIRIEVAGSLRRHNEIIHDIDVLVSTKTPKTIHESFVSYSEVDQILAHGDTKSSVILKSGLQADLRTVSDREYPYALYYFTGSKEHNVTMRLIAKRRGLKISEYGIFKGKKLIPCKDEAAIFKTFGLEYVTPELRENTGEIECAQKGKLPNLVTEKDIKGIFHVHSTYSDGRASLEAMVVRAQELGYEYVGLSDHSQTATYAHGLTAARVKEQHKEIDRLRKKLKRIKIFRGIESDILADGALDYPEKVLREFDFIIGSIHSRFNLSEKEMTERICNAVEHPRMTMLGHPTGRLLLGRPGYALNFDAIFDAARKADVVIEINANPHRLDLDWRECKVAKSKGLKMCINPDAHSLEGLEDVPYGVGIARKGWLEKKDVLNSMNVSEMGQYLKRRKR
jgi:DNA polymerase (family X)